MPSEVLYLKRKLNEMMAQHTGQPWKTSSGTPIEIISWGPKTR